MQTERELLIRAYAAFNARDIDAALALMQPNVTWPNGMEGGYVSGHSGVREYWTRQWNMIDPHVEPLEFRADEDGDIVVVVHQVVRNLVGAMLTDQRVLHTYEIVGGLIAHMDISEISADR